MYPTRRIKSEFSGESASAAAGAEDAMWDNLRALLANSQFAPPQTSRLYTEKRSRVDAACKRCQVAKTKCSSERPCLRCVRLHHEDDCVDLDPVPGRARRKTGGPDYGVYSHASAPPLPDFEIDVAEAASIAMSFIATASQMATVSSLETPSSEFSADAEREHEEFLTVAESLAAQAMQTFNDRAAAAVAAAGTAGTGALSIRPFLFLFLSFCPLCLHLCWMW